MDELKTSQLQTAVVGEKAPSPTTKWWVLLAWVGLFALLGIIAIGMVSKQRPPVEIGKEVPDFTLTTFEAVGPAVSPSLNSGQIRLADLRGKIVVINFWASWCKPCEQEAADLEAAWRFYASRGDVIFLGIAWTDTEPASRAYITKFDITYLNGPDLGTRISQAFRTTGVPETYIVDRNGILVYKKFSPFLSLNEIKAAIDPLLGP